MKPGAAASSLGARVPALLLLALACVLPARAEFAAAVSPPRFELTAEPGQVLRQVVEIAHVGAAAADYRVYTNDWTLGAGGELSYFDELTPGSCRPWVAIERRSVTIAAATKLRYRFEVAPPPGTPPGECRFALMIESQPAAAGAGAANFPMSGRIAVIVYVRIGGVAPELRIEGTLSTRIDGRDVPALRVRNIGAATGRLVGFLDARDAEGRLLELAPDAIPVLPGMTRVVGLLPVLPADRPGEPLPRVQAWPLAVKGTLEVGGQPGARLTLDQSFHAP